MNILGLLNFEEASLIGPLAATALHSHTEPTFWGSKMMASVQWLNAYVVHGAAAIASGLLLALSGCSTVSIEQANALGKTGLAAATDTVANVSVTAEEFDRAMDAEAFIHGRRPLDSSPLLKAYEALRDEINARLQVYDKLRDAYVAFGALAASNASADVEAGISSLGDSVNAYAVAVKQPPPLTASTVGVVAAIGGVLVTERQKRALKTSSEEIRTSLTAFVQILETKPVRQQVLDYKMLLDADRFAVVEMLLTSEALDPTPLIDQLGSGAGVSAIKDFPKSGVMRRRPEVRDGIVGLARDRLRRQTASEERSYLTSVKLLNDLIAEHKKFEAGVQSDLANARALVAELRRITRFYEPPLIQPSK